MVKNIAYSQALSGKVAEHYAAQYRMNFLSFDDQMNFSLTGMLAWRICWVRGYNKMAHSQKGPSNRKYLRKRYTYLNKVYFKESTSVNIPRVGQEIPTNKYHQ